MAFRLYTYALTYDTGFAPCYDNGEFTLACCKPNLRANLCNNPAQDVWVMGYRRVRGDEVYPVYIAKIERVLCLEEYYDSGVYDARADCIYSKVASLAQAKRVRKAVDIRTLYPTWSQKPGRPEDAPHKDDGKGGYARADLYGNCVLYSTQFAHFPEKEVAMPDLLLPLTRNNRDFKIYPNQHSACEPQVQRALEALLLSSKREAEITPWDNK